MDEEEVRRLSSSPGAGEFARTARFARRSRRTRGVRGARLIAFVGAALLFLSSPAAGVDYRSPEVEAELGLVQKVFRERFVYSPLDPAFAAGLDQETVRRIYGAYRILCSDPEDMQAALAEAGSPPEDARASVLLDHSDRPRKDYPAGWVGVLYRLEGSGVECEVQVTTYHAHRWNVWARGTYVGGEERPSESLDRYGFAVGAHLQAVDRAHAEGSEIPAAPRAREYDIEEVYDLFTEPPPYVIEGYRNYLDYLESHREIRWPLMQGIYEFWPTRETLDRLIALAPRGELFRNKEISMFQQEVRKFAERGGDFRSIFELDAESFSSLEPGLYFFGLDRYGRILCGRELHRTEILKAEQKGIELPRANHAFLFPGEALLSAGEMEIARARADAPEENVLVLLNTASGHYFYSNKTETIRTDIADEGDRYFLSLGHVVRVLGDMGISLDQLRLAKF